MDIVVLAGGLSPERDVSLSSGALIANALLENGHRVLLLDLYLGIHGDIPSVYKVGGDSPFSYTVPCEEPDLQAVARRADNRGALVGEGVLEFCRAADKVFLGLHGAIGENGQLQALLDIFGISYTGTGYEGSLLAMDKDISKKLMAAAGILTPRWQTLDLQTEGPWDDVPLPCVVKPCSCGSSVGVSMVETSDQLSAALNAAKLYENLVLAEEKIFGREFSVGILGGEALPPIEIKPLSGFYDYKNKYQQGLSQEICPAEIAPELTAHLQREALAVHRLLRLGFYSRIDFMMDAAGKVFCLEANTLPGMTPTSLLPQEAAAAGISYNQLCQRIVLGQ